MNYQQLKSDFEASGLTQKAFGELRGMSNSMVSYYLRRAREDSDTSVVGQFQEVSISDSLSQSRHIKIVTPDGLEISIPI